jgi:hypothetical protein
MEKSEKADENLFDDREIDDLRTEGGGEERRIRIDSPGLPGTINHPAGNGD